MNVPLSIDGGTLTGWGLWRPGLPKPRGGVLEMPDVERDIGWWGEAFLDWVIPFSRLEGVTEMVFEAPIIVKHKRAGAERCQACGQTKSDINFHEVEKLVSLSAFAKFGARQLGIPFRSVQRGVVSKHFVGVGPRDKDFNSKYLKSAFIVCCQRKGWEVASAKHPQDLADALGTLDWYVHDRGIKVPWNCQPAPGPLFEQRGVRIDATNQAAAKRLINSALSFDREKQGVR